MSVLGRMVGWRDKTASTWAKTASLLAYGWRFWRSHLCVSDCDLLIAGDNELKAVRARTGAVVGQRAPRQALREIGPTV